MVIQHSNWRSKLSPSSPTFQKEMSKPKYNQSTLCGEPDRHLIFNDKEGENELKKINRKYFTVMYRSYDGFVWYLKEKGK